MTRERRDPARTQERILAAARAAFCAHGLGGATIENIARDAKINKRMVYHYFGGKEDLYLAVLESVYEARRAHDALVDLKGVDPEEGLRRLIRRSFEYCAKNPDYIKLLIVENLAGAVHLRRSARILALHQPLLATLEDLLDRGWRLGLFRRHIDPLQLYLSIASLCFFYFSNNATLSTIFGRDLLEKESLAARASHVEELLLAYVRPRTGLEARARDSAATGAGQDEVAVMK